jgi:hypothetical protein
MAAYIGLHDVSALQVKRCGYKQRSKNGAIRNWSYTVDVLDGDGKLLSELNLYAKDRLPVLDALLDAAAGDIVYWDVD